MTLDELEECNGVPKKKSCSLYTVPPYTPYTAPAVPAQPTTRLLYGRGEIEKRGLTTVPNGMPNWHNYMDVDD